MASMTSTRSTIAARPLALAAAVVSGALLAVQSRMNGAISERTSQPLIAALWSFASGLVVLCLAVLSVPSVRRGVAGIGRALRDRRLAWWQCLGGVVGGTLVAVQAWSVPLIGVTIFSVAVVGGQTLSALAVDRFGLGPVGVQTVTGLRVVAALVAVAGVVVSATGRGGGELHLLPALATFAVGIGLAVQQALNGRVSVANGSPMATTWQNFLVGTITLVVVSIVSVARNGTDDWSIPQDVPLWALPGGLLGIVFIALTAWGVRVTGVLVFGLLSIAGQLLAALVLDLASFRDLVGPQLIVGLVITLLAAVAAGVGPMITARRSRQGRVAGNRSP